MTRASAQRLVNELAELKHQFSRAHAKRILSLINQISRLSFTSAELLILFHETLLFLRAYPQNAAIIRASETQLRNFSERIALAIDKGEDLSTLEHPEMSGIMGLPVTDTFTYDIVAWLSRRRPTEVALDWEWFEDENRLGETWPRFMPLLEEDAFVEANIPYRDWLKAARNGRAELSWLLKRFNSLSLPGKTRAELFNSQKLYVRWAPSYDATRTGMRLPGKKVFYHREPLIQRREVSFKIELDRQPPQLRRLSSRQGQKILDLAREASTVRYRELYGFTHGDYRSVFSADLGRGVIVFVTGVPPDRRLPLRAYHSAMIFKNGVPIGYFEGLSLFERMESGFNLYYTFRDGETAWLYARTLNVMRHFTGVSAFALDPYQIGFENEEGIESGAFWFYRKLGFRPTRRSLLTLMQKEEKKINTRHGYRSSATTLRKLAEGPMILELSENEMGDWDRFQLRNVGLAVQRYMAMRFDGDAERMRESTTRRMDRLLGVNAKNLKKVEGNVFSDFAAVLSLVPDIHQWRDEEKEQLVGIIRAKASSDEATYLRRMMNHGRLRKALIKLGS